MKNKDEILEIAENFTKNFMKKNDPSHDWYHVERVYKNAIFIAEQEKSANPDLYFDLEIVKLAALFHDIVDFKYDHDKSKDMNEIVNERLNDFFSQVEYPDDRIQKILYIVLNISWRKELELCQSPQDIPIELKIVRDADRLDAIGAVGVARCFAFSGAKYRPLYVENEKPILNMTAEEYNKQTIKNESNAVNHFYEKLLLIKDKMQTGTGKLLAEQRHEFMVQYLKQFDLEVHPTLV